jgi:hypothetical protein
LTRKKALIIAVSDYNANSGLSNLAFCKNDGEQVLEILKNLGYEIVNQAGLIGYVEGTKMQDAIYDFFTDDGLKSDDTVLFYFSGHGIPGAEDFFLSSSNIDQRSPKKRGFSFEDLNLEIRHCRSKKKVIILDSCYAGSARVDGKGGNESTIALTAKNTQDQIFEGEGTCLLSSCMGFQESFGTSDGNNSFFTSFLIKGLKGANGKSVNSDGAVTPNSLMDFIDRELDYLPTEKKPMQTPLRKIMTAGNPIILAQYPEFSKPKRAKMEILDIIKQKPSEKRSLAVGLIKTKSGKTANGFLIGPNIVMTDNQVIPSIESAISSYIEFNDHIADETLDYLPSQQITISRDPFELDPFNIFITSNLGYSIVSTKRTPGNDYGWIKLSSHKAIKPKQLLYLIYYIQNNKIIDIENNHLIIDEGNFNKIIFESEASEITTGAPIFDGNWNLMSMYKKNTNGPDLTRVYDNQIFDIKISKRKLEGIRMVAIVKELETLCAKNNQMACKILDLSD